MGLLEGLGAGHGWRGGTLSIESNVTGGGARGMPACFISQQE